MRASGSGSASDPRLINATRRSKHGNILLYVPRIFIDSCRPSLGMGLSVFLANTMKTVQTPFRYISISPDGDHVARPDVWISHLLCPP